MHRLRSMSPTHSPATTPQHHLQHHPQPAQRPAAQRLPYSAPANWSPRINLRGHLGGSVLDDEAVTPLHQRAARRLFVPSPPAAPREPSAPHRASTPPGGQGSPPATPRRSPTRKVVASPQALGRLLARDPLAILQATDIPAAQQLKLMDMGLARPGALADGKAVLATVERILATAAPHLRASALMVVLEHGRRHLAPGALRLADIGQDTLETMARCELLGAVSECADAFRRCVDEAAAGLKRALGADIETKEGPGRASARVPLDDRERIWLDGPQEGLRRQWDKALQWRQAQALAHAAQRMVAFYALFDCGGFLAARAVPPAGAPAMVSDTQWCFTMEQVAWLREQGHRGSPKAQGVAIEPAWLAREARHGGPHLGMVAMEAARRLQALVPEEPNG